MRAKTLVLIGLALAAFMLAPLILAAPGADAARRVSVAQTPRRQRSAQVGVVPPTPDQYAYSSVCPLVTIPVTAGHAMLSFWHWPQREGGSAANSPLRMVEAVGQPLEVWEATLTQAGRTLYVYFGVFNNGDVAENARMWMYVDDVSLLVCPAP